MTRNTHADFQFEFKIFKVADLNKCSLSMKQNKVLILKKDKSSATQGEGETLIWELTPEETKLFEVGTASIQLNFETNAGKRGASKKFKIQVDDNQEEGDL